MSDNREIAIKLNNVKKMYRLGQIGGGTLQADLQSWWARKRGKEDPNVKIGQEDRARLVGQTFMALNGIDLTIYKGEAVGIIGSNGAGKSTMLKLLSRVTAPTTGEIDIYGRITSMLEVGTGFNGEMTGRENVYLNGAILGMTKAEIDAKMEQIIEFSEVRDFIDTPVKRYSSGMYVKLAFSVAAHLDSEIMIMDEVLAVGDMAFQKKCLEKMKDAATKEGKTVLYVSHNMNTIRKLCDRCIVLDKGKVIFDGDVEEAIGIYLNCAVDTDTKKDYSEYERPKYLGKPRVKLLSAEYVNKESTVFRRNEPLVIHFKWENMIDVKDMGIRIEVISSEGVPLSSFLLQDFYSGKKGEVFETDVEFDASCLVESTYKTIITLFGADEVGNNTDYDNVQGLCFEKVFADDERAFVWATKYWGHVKMPEPKVLT